MAEPKQGWFREDSGSGPANTYYAKDGSVYRCKKDTMYNRWDVWKFGPGNKLGRFQGATQTLRAAREYVEYVTSERES